jgi:hypothetical protein
MPKLNAVQFEELRRRVFIRRVGVQLRPGEVKGVPELFEKVPLQKFALPEKIKYILGTR